MGGVDREAFKKGNEVGRKYRDQDAREHFCICIIKLSEQCIAAADTTVVDIRYRTSSTSPALAPWVMIHRRGNWPLIPGETTISNAHARLRNKFRSRGEPQHLL